MTDQSNTEHIRRTDEGASVELAITRGTGTRDQDKWKLKGKGENAEEAITELRQELRDIMGIDTSEPLADQVRDFQPGAGE